MCGHRSSPCAELTLIPPRPDPPPPGGDPTTATCFPPSRVTESTTLEGPLWPPHSTYFYPSALGGRGTLSETQLLSPQIRIKPPTLSGSPGTTGSARRKSVHQHVNAFPHGQYSGVWVFPSSILKEPKSREMENPKRKRTDEKSTRGF